VFENAQRPKERTLELLQQTKAGTVRQTFLGALHVLNLFLTLVVFVGGNGGATPVSYASDDF
jgi:hypothetical protein